LSGPVQRHNLTMIATKAQPKEWTFLFYNAGSKDQSKMCANTLRDLETVGSNQDMDIVCLNERWSWAGDRFDKSNQGTRLYHVQKDPKADQPKSGLGKLWQFLKTGPRHFYSTPDPSFPKNTHLGSAETLRNFLTEATEKYPAKHYALIISGHGAGFGGQSVMHQSGDTKSCRIENEDLGKVLNEFSSQRGEKLELINLNTCLAAGLETLDPIADGAQVAVASSGVVFAATQPFGKVLQWVQGELAQNRVVDAKALGASFIEESADQPLSNLFTGTLSAIDLSQVQQISSNVAKLHQSLMEEKVDPKVFKEALEAAVKIDYSRHERPLFLTDLGSLAMQLGQRLPEGSSSAKVCQELKQSVFSAVYQEQHQDPEHEDLLSAALRLPLGKIAGKLAEPNSLNRSSGLTIHYDPQPNAPNNRTKDLIHSPLSRETQLSEFLTYLNNGQALSAA
jgi:hypothetical protein